MGIPCAFGADEASAAAFGPAPAVAVAAAVPARAGASGRRNQESALPGRYGATSGITKRDSSSTITPATPASSGVQAARPTEAPNRSPSRKPPETTICADRRARIISTSAPVKYATGSASHETASASTLFGTTWRWCCHSSAATIRPTGMSTSAPSHAYHSSEKTEMYSEPETPPSRLSIRPDPVTEALSEDSSSKPVM